MSLVARVGHASGLYAWRLEHAASRPPIDQVMGREIDAGAWRALASVAALALPRARRDGGAPRSHAFGLWRPAPPTPARPAPRLLLGGRPRREALPDMASAAGRQSRDRRAAARFGHEHGRNPARSDLAGWVARHLAADGREARAGIPFGVANEALDDYAAANPGTPTRHEDHVGPQGRVGERRRARARGRRSAAAGSASRCDFLTKLHQGSHSADALGNNVHELLYAVRCDDGTSLIATKLVSVRRRRTSSSAPATRRRSSGAGTSHTYPAGGGVRFIPDRACIESHVLVAERPVLPVLAGPLRGLDLVELPAHRARATRSPTSTPTSRSSTPAATATRAGLDRPRRRRSAGRPRPNGEPARGGACDDATAVARSEPDPLRLPGVPLRRRPPRGLLQPDDGRATRTARGAGGPTPTAATPRTEPFPGAVCQLVAPHRQHVDRPTLESQAFGADRPYGGRGVHAPN